MLNPIVYTEKVISDFLKYQLSTYQFADTSLYEQMKTLLNLKETRNSPLLQGPFINLSQSFRTGKSLNELVSEKIIHKHLPNIAPFPTLYFHQERALRSVISGNHTLVSTGTGSGKTECFLYPIIDKCLKLRDENAPPGIVAVIVYPMNALAEDQLSRLRELLAGTGITFGMYVGKTPGRKVDVTGKRLEPGTSREDYKVEKEKSDNKRESYAVYPFEEKPSREEMKKEPPRILLTNVKQLELILTRYQDTELFEKSRLDYLVFDEAHTFKGAAGAETACLIRRLKAFCNKGNDETICIATSATIADPNKGTEAAQDFAAKFFAVSKAKVTFVTEEYESDAWAENRNLPSINLEKSDYINFLNTFEKENEEEIIPIAEKITGFKADVNNWQNNLYDYLSRNDLVYRIAKLLKRPKQLKNVCLIISAEIKRTVSEEEILFWLTLGTYAVKDGKHLLRPVVHAFVRGISGAVVTFPENNIPKLYLSAEEISEEKKFKTFEVLSCNTCGQHYFIHFIKDFHISKNELKGGEILGDNVKWESLSQSRSGNRIILLDKLISFEEEDDNEEMDIPSTKELYLCRVCGCAHYQNTTSCLSCGIQDKLVKLFVVKQKDESEQSKLRACLSCKSRGSDRPGGFREPARPVRATTSSDVHIVAQNMIQHAQHKKLLIFSDNRQDAAFQAGWMKDHARRYRLRTLIYERIKESPATVGDLTVYLDDILEQDDTLSRSLIPEVWNVYNKETETQDHNKERKYFIRIQVIRELTTGLKFRVGLEPWGRIKVDYKGLDLSLEFFQIWGKNLGISPSDLIEGVASILDLTRRDKLFYDRVSDIYSKWWMSGDRQIQRSYFPELKSGPQGLKLTRGKEDSTTRVKQWISEKAQTKITQIASKWNIPQETYIEFLKELWKVLTDDLQLIIPVALKGAKDKNLPGCAGVYQLDADKVVIHSHDGFYRCGTCRRKQNRKTPNNSCIAWRCQGKLNFEIENPDDYDLMVLDQQFAMVKPREHSAQVPASERETIERIFKSESDAINTLVCTPTLEMGVDIGALDIVLMRNVPPLPSNYWQRVGRAGRRNRMSVILTYARPASHDKSYYQSPEKLLEGIVLPPRFNLKNELMVEKHIHATILTVLRNLSISNTIEESEKEEIKLCLEKCFPISIKSYLFEQSGSLRSSLFNFSAFEEIISKHQNSIFSYVKNIFGKGTETFLNDENLKKVITNSPERLSKVVSRLDKRVKWAMSQLHKLNQISVTLNKTLENDEKALRQRCEKIIEKLKDESSPENNTYNILSLEGFLPGYGMDTGSILGTAYADRSKKKYLELPRPTAIALREYIPGNLLYANQEIYYPRFFHLEPVEPLNFKINLDKETITEISASGNSIQSNLSDLVLKAVSITDVDMVHQSNINDEESYRFQLAVTISGTEQKKHNGGKEYLWGSGKINFRKGVSLRLVNIGASKLVDHNNEIGYPLCLICGESKSPFANKYEMDNFQNLHLQRCGKSPEKIGFYADINADSICIKDCKSNKEAYSIAEVIRVAAANKLEMELEDLQLLLLSNQHNDNWDILIYDPMPGGSGLLDQIIEKWSEIIGEALVIASNCPSKCDSTCIDCLNNFRNVSYQIYLDRNIAFKILSENEDKIIFSHDIPSEVSELSLPIQNQTANNSEQKLLKMLISAGFPEPEQQKNMSLGRPLGSTTPDFYYESDNFEGVCIYLDGMSRFSHGTHEAQTRDRQIRDELRNRGYEVIEIPNSNMDNKTSMIQHFQRLGRILSGKEKANQIKENTEWFDVEEELIIPEFDIDRDFNPIWHKIIKTLIAKSYKIEQGNDITSVDGVIGTYIFKVSKINKNVFIVPSTVINFESIRNAFDNNDNKAIHINPNESLDDNIEKILSSLEV